MLSSDLGLMRAIPVCEALKACFLGDRTTPLVLHKSSSELYGILAVQEHNCPQVVLMCLIKMNLRIGPIRKLICLTVAKWILLQEGPNLEDRAISGPSSKTVG